MKGPLIKWALPKMTTSSCSPTLFLNSPPRALNAPSRPGMDPFGLNWPLQNRQGPSKQCNLLIFRKGGQWKAASLDRCSRKCAVVSERAVKFHHFLPLWVRHCELARQPFPLYLTKGPRTFLILKRSSQVSKGYMHTEGAFKPASTHLQRGSHDGASLFGWWRITSERTLKANVAHLEAFRVL